MLVLLYYLSQNDDFSESVKPLMGKIKDSEEMLRFLNDLSKFTQTFSAFQPAPPQQGEPPRDKKTPRREEGEGEKKMDKKTPQSPTTGIADEFIQNILDSYLAARK